MTRADIHVRFAGLAILWSLVLGATDTAGAEDRHARAFLEWDRSLDAHGCGPRERVVVEIERRLGRSLGASSRVEAELVLEARAVEGLEGRGLGAVLTLRRPRGEALGVRQIATDDVDCTTLSDGLPLVIALLVDLSEREAMLRLPSPRLPRETAAHPPRDADEPTSGAWAASLEAGASLDLGSLPGPALAVELVGVFGPVDSWLAVASRAGILTPSIHEAAMPGAVEIWGVRGALGLAVGAPFGPLRLDATGLLEAGWLRIDGRAFDVSRGAEALHLAAVVMFGATLIELAPFSLRVEVGGSVPLVAQRLSYEDNLGAHEFFVSGPVTFRAGLAVGLRTQ